MAEIDTRKIDLGQFVRDFAYGLCQADAKGPRSKRWSPGIGPFDEPQAVRLIFDELATLDPAHYGPGDWDLEVPYPGQVALRLDVQLGSADAFGWAIEVKMMRQLRNNGDVEPSAVGHILSPYEASALTDCQKLVSSSLRGRKAILIYGFDYDEYPLQLMLDAFERLAQHCVELRPCHAADFDGLVHPYHRRGRVAAWEIASART